MTLSEVLSWKVSDAIKSVPETVVYVLLEQFGGLCKSVLLLGVVPGVTVTPVGPSLGVYLLCDVCGTAVCLRRLA